MANCIVLADCEEKSSTWEKKLELAAEPRDEQKKIWGERKKWSHLKARAIVYVSTMQRVPTASQVYYN